MIDEKGRHCNRYWFCDECAASVAHSLDSIENWMPIKPGSEVCGKQSLWGKLAQDQKCSRPATMVLQTRRRLSSRVRNC